MVYQRKLWREATTEALVALKEAGVTITEPDKAPFREAVQKMHRSYQGTPLGEFLNRISAVP